ncbi:hypothetical protein SUGI_0499380 [Cryptomeria japonica]|nr:hypothetical protein SUGI_0499380 [Cryptomeria japonica]
MAKKYEVVEEEENFCELKSEAGGIYLLTFGGRDKHFFDPAAIRNINESLDKVEGDKSATVLVTTNEGKFFSNGMDAKYLRQVDLNTAKNLTTYIAVIRGHAVGAGCIFALA